MVVWLNEERNTEASQRELPRTCTSKALSLYHNLLGESLPPAPRSLSGPEEVLGGISGIPPPAKSWKGCLEVKQWPRSMAIKHPGLNPGGLSAWGDRGRGAVSCSAFITLGWCACAHSQSHIPIFSCATTWKSDLRYKCHQTLFSTLSHPL